MPHTYEDEFAFNSCRRQVTQYLNGVDRYVDCLAQRQDDALNDANRTIEQFNCRTEGRAFCS